MSGAGKNLRLNGLTVVMMLVLLCLTVFGVLSLTSASAASGLAQKNAEHTASYAECDAEAQRRLFAAANAALEGSQSADLSQNELGETIIAFTTERHDGLAISVKAALNNGALEISSYKLITENTLEYDGAGVDLLG